MRSRAATILGNALATLMQSQLRLADPDRADHIIRLFTDEAVASEKYKDALSLSRAGWTYHFLNGAHGGSRKIVRENGIDKETLYVETEEDRNLHKDWAESAAHYMIRCYDTYWDTSNSDILASSGVSNPKSPWAQYG